MLPEQTRTPVRQNPSTNTVTTRKPVQARLLTPVPSRQLTLRGALDTSYRFADAAREVSYTGRGKALIVVGSMVTVFGIGTYVVAQLMHDLAAILLYAAIAVGVAAFIGYIVARDKGGRGGGGGRNGDTNVTIIG